MEAGLTRHGASYLFRSQPLIFALISFLHLGEYGVRAMGFIESIKSAYSKYLTFSGRASRSEYWWFQLFYIIVAIGISFVSYAAANTGADSGLSSVMLIWELGNVVPLLAVQVRRLHDIDRSGWWCLLALVPLIGWIIVLVWDCTEGTGGDNRFGADPLLPTVP
jgi:uncharacterized membrane protein YhaH (DUF805 family)